MLKMDAEAEAWKNVHYLDKFKELYLLGNENVMSYFARMYDNYFYKFCILIWLMEMTHADWEFLKANTLNLKVWSEFLDAMPVTLEIVQQAWYLCEFYMANTMPLITIMEERDKLQLEKRLIGLLINAYNGVADHTSLLNRSHLKKREFHEAIESLIERNAIWVEAGNRSANNTVPKIYKVNKVLYENWKSGVKDFSTLSKSVQFQNDKTVTFENTG